MNNGISYCRVSSKEQIEGTSLGSQELGCRESARAKHVEILKVFVERGESAKFADRTELLEMLEYCRKNKGKIRYLFIWKIDRLARNVSDFFSIKALLAKYGVEVVSVTEPIDSNPEGKLLETILAGFAQFDNDVRAMRTVQGMRSKLRDGIFPWHPPLGYKCSYSHQRGMKKTEPDTPNEPLFGLLRKAWNEFATGAYTKAEMRRLMAHWGILTRKGTPFSAQSIDNLFRNKYYAGILIDPWSGEEHEGKHIPMVNREIFARVQGIVSRRNRSKPHQKQRPEFPLRGVVRCAGCRRYLTGGFSRGRSGRYAYYFCGNKKCTARQSHPASTIHGEFQEFLKTLSLKPEYLAKLEARIIEKAEETQALAKAQRGKRQAEIQHLGRQMQQLIAMRSKELLTDEEFREQKGLLAEKKFALESAMEQKAVDAHRIREEIRAITAPLADLCQAWGRFDPASCARFNRMLLPAGFLVGQIRTADKARLFSLAGQIDDPNSTEVAPMGDFLNRITQELSAFATLFRGDEADELLT